MRLSASLLARRLNFRDTPFSDRYRWSYAYANLPERYRIRKSYKLKEISPDLPGYKPRFKVVHSFEYKLRRPWSNEFWDHPNELNCAYNQAIVQPILAEDWMWFKGDRVELLTGPDKGKQGYINYVVQERNWVCVEGLNVKYNTMAQSKDFPGLMYKDEKPLLVTSDIKLVDPSNEQATEVEWRFTEEGERVRVCVGSGHILPIPSEAFETIDYKTQQGYVESKEKDTSASQVEEVTFVPKLATFEMDIMQSMGIKEDRKGLKTWWY